MRDRRESQWINKLAAGSASYARKGNALIVVTAAEADRTTTSWGTFIDVWKGGRRRRGRKRKKGGYKAEQVATLSCSYTAGVMTGMLKKHDNALRYRSYPPWFFFFLCIPDKRWMLSITYFYWPSLADQYQTTSCGRRSTIISEDNNDPHSYYDWIIPFQTRPPYVVKKSKHSSSCQFNQRYYFTSWSPCGNCRFWCLQLLQQEIQRFGHRTKALDPMFAWYSLHVENLRRDT